jgi:hypothetical protein
MSNRLARETSPYLLQHADNPVDWHAWGPEALTRAREEDKPIFLSIGYASCHWCHVMAHESFEDPAIAGLLNERFVSIKVDREERPDLDALYMDAVTALTGQGGWPLTVFLTPEGRPFYGGTYFPPAPRHGLPSFREVLLAVDGAWREKREDVGATAKQLAEHMSSAPALRPGEGDLSGSTLDRAAEALFRSYDWNHGGWGGAPKFPQAHSIELLLRRHYRRADRLALDMATQCLRSMADGGIYDHLGGGFHRYATDRAWRIPHFEKMLYDNALLARVYLHAWQVTGEPRLRAVTEETLDFLLREMRHPEGGLYSALDADSAGEEGAYYLWALQDVEAVLKSHGLSDLFVAAYGLTQEGNLEGRNVLYRASSDGALAERFGLDEREVAARLTNGRDLLRQQRDSRPRPATDDKILTVWNGLALSAVAEAARALPRPDYLRAAQELAGFLLDSLFLKGTLQRSWRTGRAQPAAFLDDHAALGLGLLSLYQADPDPSWFSASVRLAEAILDRFADASGGFFDTPKDHETLIARPKSIQDHATPSGNALAAELLMRLWALTGEEAYRRAAEPSLRAIQGLAATHPQAFAAWLCVMDLALGRGIQLAIAGKRDDPALMEFLEVVWPRYLPDLALAAGEAADKRSPRLLEGRQRDDGRAAAYLCQGFVCELPALSPADLERQLREALQGGRSEQG